MGFAMSTLLAGVRPFPQVLAKYLLFGLVGLMLAYVLVHDESFLVNPKDPIWTHYQPFKWWLLPHGVAGACALLLGPMQFSERLRCRFRKLHRVLGRVYIAGVFIAAPLGVYIQYFEERMGDTRSFTVAAIVDAILLMGTTAVALAFILKGDVQQHRQWMTRSFAVALVFLEGRVVGGVTGWENLGNHTDETIVWACLAFSILSADLVLLLQELGRRHTLYPTTNSVKGTTR
jgi:uncharacterized membrane protein